MTEVGCETCAAHTYSGDGAEQCTACPPGKGSLNGSISEEDCTLSEILIVLLKIFHLIHKVVNILSLEFRLHWWPQIMKFAIKIHIHNMIAKFTKC